MPGYLIWPICHALPNMMIMCPADEAELKHMTTTAAAWRGAGHAPCATRAGPVPGPAASMPAEVLEMGTARAIRQGGDICDPAFGNHVTDR